MFLPFCMVYGNMAIFKPTFTGRLHIYLHLPRNRSFGLFVMVRYMYENLPVPLTLWESINGLINQRTPKIHGGPPLVS